MSRTPNSHYATHPSNVHESASSSKSARGAASSVFNTPRGSAWAYDDDASVGASPSSTSASRVAPSGSFLGATPLQQQQLRRRGAAGGDGLQRTTSRSSMTSESASRADVIPATASLFDVLSPAGKPIMRRTTSQTQDASSSEINTHSRMSLDDDDISHSRAAGPSELKPPRAAFMSPTRVDPFYQEGANITSAATFDSRWVTVFGFQAADTAEILRKFQAYGEIVKHKNEGHGNWMHLCYQTKLQAQRALSKNGSVVSGNIMIGVVPCIAPLARLDLGTGSLAQMSRARRALASETGTVQHASVFRSATRELGVDATGSAPTPVTSFWSKCLEYMFGF